MRGDNEARIKQFPKALIEELLQVEINRHLGAQRYERSDDRRDWRNGSYERTLSTRCGTVEDPAHPANAKQRLRPQLFDRYERRKSVDELRYPGVSRYGSPSNARFPSTRGPGNINEANSRVPPSVRPLADILILRVDSNRMFGAKGLTIH